VNDDSLATGIGGHPCGRRDRGRAPLLAATKSFERPGGGIVHASAGRMAGYPGLGEQVCPAGAGGGQRKRRLSSSKNSTLERYAAPVSFLSSISIVARTQA
jgi:hypothetical protein